MTDLMGLLSIVLLSGLAGWTVMALVAYAASGCIGESDTQPVTRRARAEWVAAMPPTGFLLAVSVVLLPAVLKATGFIADHCLEHGLHHLHICFAHLPAFTPGLPLGIMMTAGLGAGVLAPARRGLQQLRDFRLARRIDHLASSRWPVLSTDLPGVQALLLGRRKPRIVLSRSFSSLLTPAERRAVLRHEIAHARAGDPRRKQWLEFLLAFHPSFMRDSVRARWRQAVEEIADDRVTEQGGALDLAQALVKSVRYQGPGMTWPSDAMAVTASDLGHRVRRLTDEKKEYRVSIPVERGLLFLPVMVAAWAAANHHALEHVLETVLVRVTGG